MNYDRIGKHTAIAMVRSKIISKLFPYPISNACFIFFFLFNIFAFLFRIDSIRLKNNEYTPKFI